MEPRLPILGKRHSHRLPPIFVITLFILFIGFSFKSVSSRASVESSPQTIYFPGSAFPTSSWRSSYPVQLLELAIERCDKAYQLEPSDIVSPKARNFTLLGRKQGVDIVWSMTRKERERLYRPIRIPIFKGLSGWRIPLVHRNNSDLLSSVSSIEELRDFSVGQMHAWTDAKILQYNGFEVDNGPTYESMFRMLAAQRFDYFPRSMVEALSEYKIYKDNHIVIEPNIVIQYPTAIYFFVHKENAELAYNIEKGLEEAIADGSFDKLFYKHYRESFKKTNMPSRKVFRLNNPYLPDETPIKRAELWINPQSMH